MKRKTTCNNAALSADATPRRMRIPSNAYNQAMPRPSEQTLSFLRGLARNLRTETCLPQGLQRIMLG